jgi:hypothetical protein
MALAAVAVAGPSFQGGGRAGLRLVFQVLPGGGGHLHPSRSLDSMGEPAGPGQAAGLSGDARGTPIAGPTVPDVVTDTVVSLRIVSAGVARAGLPYFTVWPPSLRERPQCGVHLHNSRHSGPPPPPRPPAVQLSSSMDPRPGHLPAPRSGGLAGRIAIFSLMGN